MGWGCYKHEMDAGSESWESAKTELMEQQEKLDKSGIRTFFRDDESCVHYYEAGHETGDVEFPLETASIDGIELMSEEWEIVG